MLPSDVKSKTEAGGATVDAQDCTSNMARTETFKAPVAEGVLRPGCANTQPSAQSVYQQLSVHQRTCALSRLDKSWLLKRGLLHAAQGQRHLIASLLTRPGGELRQEKDSQGGQRRERLGAGAHLSTPELLQSLRAVLRINWLR